LGQLSKIEMSESPELQSRCFAGPIGCVIDPIAVI
jgi:hypothetical protein